MTAAMRINDDFGVRVAIHAAALPWIASPTPGVERRMLDRVGGEVARATSIVRYAAGSRFPAHVHGGGEEFLVLDGVFSDETGDFPAGTYVRNPPGSRHAPASAAGCTIFVKLRQFAADDGAAVRVDTAALGLAPVAGRAGVTAALLHRHGAETVWIEQWAPGARIALDVPGGAELLVCDGGFEDGGGRFGSQSWLRLPAGARLDAVAGAEGCRLWIKTGHLADPPL
jgi:quercetin dioxygenase-like cupin family protein